MHLPHLGKPFQHFCGCIVRDLNDVLSALINAFLTDISVEPVTRPQLSYCSLDMVHSHQTTPHNITLGWPTIDNNVQLFGLVGQRYAVGPCL
ncbi:hypothetical protein GBAR_LOCUS31595, partial [Geodia barretti]